MRANKKVGLIVIIFLVVALTTMASGHPDDGGGGGGGGGGGVVVETSAPEGVTEVTGDPFGETTVTGDPFGETTVTGDPFGETNVTGDPFGETNVTGDPFGETAQTFSPEAAAAAQDYLGEVDFSALAQNPDVGIPEGFAEALKDLANYQDLDPAASQYTLQNYQDLKDQVNPAEVMDLLLNIPAQDLNADTLKDVWQIPSFDDYQKMSADQAQTTLAEITVNFTIELQSVKKQDFMGLMEKINSDGDLVAADAANTLANLFDPATLMDIPLSQEGLSNWVASVTDDLSDAFLDAAQIITADFGIADFAEFSVDATFFDTVDYSDIPPIEVNPLVLQLFG